MSRPTNLGQSRGGSSRTKGAPLGSRGEMTARNSAAGGTDNEYAFLTRSSAGAGFDSSFSCANCLNLTHQLMPSGLPLIGPLYPGLKCFHGVSVQESFFLNIKWCLCYAGGAFVTLLPILVDWPKMLNYPFDISYAVITYLFVAGQTVGQTNKYVWQAVVGSLTAAVAPHLAVTTFAQDGSAQAGAAGWFSVAVFLFFYVLVVLTLPMEKITKKFALIICIHFLMRKACIADSAFEPNSQCDATSQDVEQWSAVTFRMLLQGLWGCVPALVSVVLQGSFAMWEADKCAKKAIALLKLTLEPLLRSFADEVTALNCARIDMYFAEIDDNIQRAERALGDAYFEPFSGESVRSTTAILDVACKLRSTLIGMSEALRVKDKRGFDPTVHKQLVAEMRAPVFSILNQSLQLLDTELGAIRNPTRYHVTSLAPKPIEGEEQTEEMAFWRSRAQSDEIKGKLEKELNRGGALEKTKEEKKHFHAALSRLRTSPLTSKADMDSVFMMFLFNLTGFTQELLEFPDSFASSLQRQQSDKSWFEADTKMVALQFSKKQIIAAMKTAIAITVAASVNTYYDYNPFAPIMMAYLMAGHIGSSYATTQQRVVGLIVGTISSFFFMNLTRCEPWWTAIGFTIIVLIATYIASSNSDSAYTCQVCCVVAAVIMVRRIQTLDGNGRCRSDNVPFLEEQFEIIVQVVLSCVLLAVHEMVLWPTSSLVSLQKSVSDTITECKEAFMQLSTIPETIYGSTMKNGDAEEKKTTLDPLLMQTTIWNRIPRQLRKQRVYFREALAEPTLWDDEFPASAYKRILGTNDRLGMCMMGLCGAWNRLNILVNKDGDDLDSETGASQTANPLIIERQHVRREDLKLNDPRSRLVKVKVKSKIGDISQVKKLCQSALYSMKIRDDDMILAIKPDPSAKNTRMRVSLPMMSPKELKDLQSMLLEHNIYLNIKRKKILQHPNSQLRKEEIVVIAVRMLNEAHMGLLASNSTGTPSTISLEQIGGMNVKAEAVISFDGLDEATRKVRWLQRLGKDSGSSSWSVPRGRRSKHSLGDELTFEFKNGSVMEQIAITSWKLQECFKEIEDSLRRNRVHDKDHLHELEEAWFQTPDDYYLLRKSHNAMKLKYEVDEIMVQFDHAVKKEMHVDPASRPRSHDQETVNEDLLVLYGLCHNYKALASALVECDEIMFNGDDEYVQRGSVNMNAHGWTPDYSSSFFVSAGQGPSWYRHFHNPAIL